jgi:hypothetical protein
MSYIDLTEAYKNDSWTQKVTGRWERFGHGWQMQGGTWDKGHSIPAGHWKNSPRIDVPPVIKRLTLRGGEFEFEFHDDKIIISRMSRSSRALFLRNNAPCAVDLSYLVYWAFFRGSSAGLMKVISNGPV